MSKHCQVFFFFFFCKRRTFCILTGISCTDARTHTHTHTHTHMHTHACTHAHTHTHVHTYTHIKVHIAEKEVVFWATASYRLIQPWDAVTGQLDFVDKVALVNFCGLCRLGCVDGAELREGKYHQERQISFGRQFLSDEIAPPRPELLHATGLAHTWQ